MIKQKQLLVLSSIVPADHDVPGKYYAFITPTISGYYQANLIGKILETPVNLSLHPPPIAERSYIEFPQSADLALTEVIDENSKLEQKIDTLENTVKNLETSNNQLKDQIDGYFVILGTAKTRNYWNYYCYNCFN